MIIELSFIKIFFPKPSVVQLVTCFVIAMSSSLPFERTQTPLVVKYECGLRERLHQLVQTYPGSMKLSVKPNPSTFYVKSNGQGQGSLLISYEAPAELSTRIMQLCGISESSSSVVRILIFCFHVSCRFHSDLINIVIRALFFLPLPDWMRGLRGA